MKEYSLRFTLFTKYAHTLVVDNMTRKSMYVLRVSKDVVKECKTTMLVKGMGIPRLMVYAQLIEEERVRVKRIIQVALLSLSKGQIVEIIFSITRNLPLQPICC